MDSNNTDDQNTAIIIKQVIKGRKMFKMRQIAINYHVFDIVEDAAMSVVDEEAIMYKVPKADIAGMDGDALITYLAKFDSIPIGRILTGKEVE